MPQTTTPTITLWPSGTLLSVTNPARGSNPPANAGRGLRNKVTVFSRASRRRMLRTMAKLSKAALPIFATLTYPQSYSSNPTDWKEDLRVWGARLKRACPTAAFIWRLEFQKRGAPHFHVLIYGLTKNISDFQKWLSTSWYEVVKSCDERHLQAGTNAQHMRSYRGLMVYAGKELAKTSQALLGSTYAEGVGRWWGAFNRACLPWAESESQQISEKQYHGLIRLMRRYAHLRSRGYPSLTIFCNAEWWHARMPEILDMLS